jgi:hypothetical protein
MGAYEILRILDSFFQTRYQLLTGTVVIEIFDSIDEVCVLREVQIFFSFALFAHSPTAAVLHSAYKGQRLPMFGA